MAFIRYPDLPELPSLSRDDEGALTFWYSELQRALEQRDGRTFFGAINVSAFDTSASTTRTLTLLPSSSAAVTATYDLLATLIKLMKAKGIVA
jgi:hypothetical protein